MIPAARPAATLLGYYDKRNLGDDVFCHLFAQALKQRGYADVYLPNTAPELRRAVGGAAPIGTRRSIDRSRLVVMGGGGLLGFGLPGPREHAAFRYYSRVAWYCRLRGVPLYALSVGAGPFSTARSRRAAQRIAALAHAVVVRDEPSHAALTEGRPALAQKVRTMADVALCLDPSTVPAVESFALPRPCLGVNLCACTSFGTGPRAADANRAVISTVAAMLREGTIASVIWFSTASWGDELLWACRAHQSTPGPSRVVFYDRDPWEWIARLRACDAFLSMKLHSGVFAAAMGVPVMGIGSHPKAARFYDAVGAVGAHRSLGDMTVGEIGEFIRSRYPGATGLAGTDRWHALQRQARAVFEVIPPAGTSQPQLVEARSRLHCADPVGAT